MHRNNANASLSLSRLPHRALLALCLLAWALPGFAAMPAVVRAALDAARIPPGAVSIWVQAVDETQPLLAENAQQPMNPASVMKLATSFAAFERLGPAYTWTTTLATTGTIRQGVLRGDLYLIGGGDPQLTYERVWKLLRQVRATAGIDTIQGDIVLDDSALRLPLHDPNAFDGRGLRPYNAGPSALLLNYNALQLTLVPASQAGGSVALSADPPLEGLAVDNRLRTTDGPCGTWYAALDAHLEPGPRLVLDGSLPASCGRRDWSAAPLSAQEYGPALLAALWKEAGGRLEGKVRNGPAPAGTVELLSESSAPLADVVRDMNKWSNNVIARQLLATLGHADTAPLNLVAASTSPSASLAVADNSPDMVQGGARAAFAALSRAGVDTTGLLIENGAGLSRSERIRADTLGRLLLAAWRRPWMPEFIATLPVAGLDGTARRRLDGSPASGQVHIKTGTIDGVRAMAGYVLSHDGRRYAVVMMVNHPSAAASKTAQDNLLEWVWLGAGRVAATGQPGSSPSNPSQPGASPAK